MVKVGDEIQIVYIMSEYYYVSFKYSESVFCTNLCKAQSEDDVKKHYGNYEWYTIRPAKASEVLDAQRKGMPITVA